MVAKDGDLCGRHEWERDHPAGEYLLTHSCEHSGIVKRATDAEKRAWQLAIYLDRLEPDVEMLISWLLTYRKEEREHVAKELEQYRGLHETASDCVCKEEIVSALSVAIHRVRYPSGYDPATGLPLKVTA